MNRPNAYMISGILFVIVGIGEAIFSPSNKLYPIFQIGGVIIMILSEILEKLSQKEVK